MPFKPPPPTLEYFYDYLTRMKRGMVEFEWRSLEHNEYHSHYQDALDKCIQAHNELLTTLRQTIKFIKNHENI